MKALPPGYSIRARYQAGFSLIELMIAIALGLLIMAGMLMVFANSSATRSELDRTNRQIENGRYATELLRDDFQLAGFLGEIDMSSVGALPAAMPDPCSNTLVERTDPAGGTPGVIRLHVQGVNDVLSSYGTPAPGSPDNLSCLKDASGNFLVKPGTDVVVVRRLKTCFAGAAGCDALTNGMPYLQVSFCGKPTVPSTSGVKTHALALYPNAAEFVHQLNAAVGVACTVSSPLRPYVIYVYFVGRDYVTGTNTILKDDILKRAEFIGTGIGNVTSLVDGIENLQLEYGVDTLDAAASPPDGNANVYLSATAINAATPMPVPEKWSNVVSAQIHLLARNTEISPGWATDPGSQKTYDLGPSIVPIADPRDGFRRHVYSTLVRIQNISGRRETP